jgi:ketosteroid isomerase-like protein
MKRLWLFALVLVAMVCFVPGRGISNTRTSSSDEDTLKQLVQAWANAVVRGDVEKLEQIHAANFNGSADGISFDKRMLHDAIRNGKMKVKSWTIDRMQVTIHGNSAEVTGHATLTGAIYNGADFSGGWDFTDRFVKERNGTWRAVNSTSKRTRPVRKP